MASGIVVLGINDFDFSRDLKRLCVLKPLIVSHHLARFTGKRPCGSSNIKYLKSHVTSCNHTFRKLCDFCVEPAQKKRTTLLSLVAMGLVVAEI